VRGGVGGALIQLDMSWLRLREDVNAFLQLAGDSHSVATAMLNGLPMSLPADFHTHITFPRGGQRVATSVLRGTGLSSRRASLPTVMDHVCLPISLVGGTSVLGRPPIVAWSTTNNSGGHLLPELVDATMPRVASTSRFRTAAFLLTASNHRMMTLSSMLRQSVSARRGSRS
jgi:hypothetical protein